MLSVLLARCVLDCAWLVEGRILFLGRYFLGQTLVDVNGRVI